MATGIKVFKQADDANYERGELVHFVRVHFFVDDDGPFLEIIPKVEYTPVAVQQRLETRARDIRAARGV